MKMSTTPCKNDNIACRLVIQHYLSNDVCFLWLYMVVTLCSLDRAIRLKPEVHPVFGERVACGAVSLNLHILSDIRVQCCPPLSPLHSDFGDLSNGVCHVMKIDIAESHPDMELLAQRAFGFSTAIIIIIIIIIICPLTAEVVGAPRMISQPVSSIFPCSPLPSGTWRTPGLSIP